MTPGPRLDMRLIYHNGMKKGTSLADCQCRSCKKWRKELYAQGKITMQEAGVVDVKDEPYYIETVVSRLLTTKMEDEKV